jgi:undecaprenyl-diphosphatase
MDAEVRDGLLLFILRCALALLTLGVLAALLAFVTPLPGIAVSSDGPLVEVLGGAADFIAEISGQVGWLILPVVMLCLLMRGFFAAAVYVAAVAAGMTVLAGGRMLLTAIHRTTTDGAVIPSSASIQLTVTCGALLLVVLPSIPSKGRIWAVTGTAVSVIVFEIIRVLSGAVSIGPEIGGWLVGVAWLGATFWAFRRWQQNAGERTKWWQGLPATAALDPELPGPALPGGWASALKLAGSWLLIAGGVTGAGLLITEVLAPVQRTDQAVLEWLAEHRSDTLSALADIAGSLGTTPGIIGVLLTAAPLALTITGRAAPALFLLVVVIGETALYLVSGLIVSRPRPTVDHLTEGLPPTPSFPSGHVAAAVVMYVGLALLFRAWSQSPFHNLGLFLAPLIVLGVALSRLYWGVHYPTDTAVSVVFGAAWVLVCWRYFQPARGAPQSPPERDKPLLLGIHLGGHKCRRRPPTSAPGPGPTPLRGPV